MPTLPKFRQLASESTAERRALARVDESAIVRARKSVAMMETGGQVKDVAGRIIRVRAVDVKALLEGKRFKFVESQAHYINAARGIVPDATVKASAEAVISHSQATVAKVMRQLGQNEITLDEGMSVFQSAVLDGRIAHGALAHGGFEKLTDSAKERIEKGVFEQFNGNDKFPGLRSFAQDIASGRYGKDQLAPGSTVRALQYPQSGRIVYENEFAAAKSEAGFDEVCRILAAVNHCGSCAEEAARGFVPVDEAIPIGEDDCNSGCHCVTVWRRNGQESGPAVEAAIERAKGEAERMRQEREEESK